MLSFSLDFDQYILLFCTIQVFNVMVFRQTECPYADCISVSNVPSDVIDIDAAF